MLRRTISITICLAIIMSTLTIAIGCNKKEKKAMIILHGMMGGVLYDEDTDEPVWHLDSLGKDLGVSVINILNNKDKLFLDEDGNSEYNIRPANMNDEVGFYSILKLFEPLYNQLVPKYSEEYDIIIWQYDWRLSPETSAEQLEEFISLNNYDKVVFVAHSMGGNVVSEYLVRSEDNKSKVELFVSVCTPYFGSMQAYHFLYDGLLSHMSSYIANLTKQLGSNLPSVYMLSPSEEYQYAPEYQGNNAMLTINSVAQSYDEIEEFFKSQGFAKKRDNTLKYAYENKQQYQQGHMVEVDGEMIHISRTINTHYIQGTGWNTIKTIDINTANNKVTITANTDGDAVVSVYSGTAGMSLDADNVYVFDGPDHITMMEYTATVEVVLDILSRQLP